MLTRILRKLRAAGKQLVIAWYAFRHPATPLPAKFMLLLMAIYLISPIDLIPDAIPVLGWLDDIALVSLGLPLLLTLLPSQVLSQSKEAADIFLTRVFRLRRH